MSVSATRKVKDHAFITTPGSSGCGGRSAVAGKPFHSHAVIHQVDSEWRRGDRGGPLADERLWAISFAFEYPGWEGISTL
jgi:hypothetical protein